MSVVFKPLYTAVQAITIVLDSLADGDVAASSPISNSSDLFLDALVQLSVKTNASGVDTAAGVIRVFVIASVDGGTTYPGAPNDELLPIGVFNANADATTFHSQPMSVAKAFNGIMPKEWKLVVKNDTGAALDATEGNHTKQYQGIQGQYA